MTTTRHIFTKTVALIALTFAVLAGIAIWNSDRVKAFNPQPDPPAFAAIGVTHEQSALISARLEADTRRGSRPAQPVQVELRFEDSNGDLLGSSVQTIDPGHAVSFKLDGGTLPIGGDGMRLEVQPSIKILNNPNEGGNVRLVGGTETFDNFGPNAGKSTMGQRAG